MRITEQACLYHVEKYAFLCAMTKTEAIYLFETRVALAEAIGISAQAVSDWPEELPPRIEDRVIAAAVRTGKVAALQALLADTATPNRERAA